MDLSGNRGEQAFEWLECGEIVKEDKGKAGLEQMTKREAGT